MLFWRWPCQEIARDGIPPYPKRPMPKNQRMAQVQTPDMAKLIFAKILKYLQRGYLVMAPASLMKMLLYPKEMMISE